MRVVSEQGGVCNHLIGLALRGKLLKGGVTWGGTTTSKYIVLQLLNTPYWKTSFCLQCVRQAVWRPGASRDLRPNTNPPRSTCPGKRVRLWTVHVGICLAMFSGTVSFVCFYSVPEPPSCRAPSNGYSGITDTPVLQSFDQSVLVRPLSVRLLL